jgi:hypothetical protein
VHDLLDFIVQTAIAENQSRIRPWTREEDHFLTENLGRLSVEQVGQELGRSRTAVKVHYTRLGLLAPSRQHAVWLTGNVVARLLSVDVHSITMLAQRKLIPVTYWGKCSRIRIERVSFYVWAINPENWIYFKQERVWDPHLRRLIELRRQRWNDEWLTVSQVTTICNTRKGFINVLIRSGRLPAKRWGNWRVKRSDLIAYPPDPSRRKYKFSARADEFILKAHDEWHLECPIIGRMMKLPSEQVRMRYRLMRKIK